MGAQIGFDTKCIFNILVEASLVWRAECEQKIGLEHHGMDGVIMDA